MQYAAASQEMRESMRHTFSLGPLVGPSIASLPGEENEHSPWQYGVASAKRAVEDRFGPMTPLVAMLAAPFALVTEAHLPLLVKMVLASLVGLLVYWLVPTVWAIVVALRAPYVLLKWMRHHISGEEARKQQALQLQSDSLLTTHEQQIADLQRVIDEYQRPANLCQTLRRVRRTLEKEANQLVGRARERPDLYDWEAGIKKLDERAEDINRQFRYYKLSAPFDVPLVREDEYGLPPAEPPEVLADRYRGLAREMEPIQKRIRDECWRLPYDFANAPFH
jgi:hypothetical protein